jgi:hypothetical protein
VPALVGTAVPLLILALGWLRLRRRTTAVILAFTLGLGTNVAFLANAVPAAAVTDNSSVFTLANTTAYSWPSKDMKQNYTPGGPLTTCPSVAGNNWVCSFSSDSFTAGQVMNAGTAQTDLYLTNNPVPTLRYTSNLSGGGNNVCTLNKPTTVVDGDVMIASCAFRGGTGTTVTSVPSGWNLVGSRIDNTTTISLVVYSHVVTDAASEPASYSWGLSAVVKFALSLQSYSGIDNVTPVDAAVGQATASATSHATPGFTTTVSNDLLLAFFATGTCTQWTVPAGMTERTDTTFCSQGQGTNADMSVAEGLLGAAGSNSGVTATNDSAAVGVTMAVALKRDATPKTCNTTVQLSKPIRYRSSDSNVATNTTSLTINKPAGVVNGDVMVASISFVLSGMTFTSLPAGWTQVRVATNGGSGVAVFVKAASGEPASYTWGTSGASNLAGGISAYIGVDNVTLVDAENGGGLANFTSVTTVTPATMLVVSSFKANAGVAITWTPPPGMNERVDRVSAAATFTSVEQADALWAPAGASGNRIAVPSDSTQPVAAATVALRPALALVGTATAAIVSPATATLISSSFATNAVTFATGDFLQLDVYAPSDQINCSSNLSYDHTSTPSKLTVATIVPEGIAGLLLLAPALPIGLRWWKRRRP